jgi:hypothetical protein
MHFAIIGKGHILGFKIACLLARSFPAAEISMFESRNLINNAQFYQDFYDAVFLVSPPWSLIDCIKNVTYSKNFSHLSIISSSSVYMKTKFMTRHSFDFFNQYLVSEQAITNFCNSANISLHIFRPTVLWGDFEDKFIDKIHTVIRILPIIPISRVLSSIRSPLTYDQLSLMIVNSFVENQGSNCGFDCEGKSRIPLYKILELLSNYSNKPCLYAPRIVDLLLLKLFKLLERQFPFLIRLREDLSLDSISDSDFIRLTSSHHFEESLQSLQQYK